MPKKFRSKKRDDGSRYAYPLEEGRKKYEEPSMEILKVPKHKKYVKIMSHKQALEWILPLVDEYPDTKLNIRQLYYRLAAAGRIPNRRRAYNATVQQLVTMREKKELDWNRIVDVTRATKGGDSGFDSPKEWFNAHLRYLQEGKYFREKWDGQPEYVEVWVEKDALLPLVESVTKEYNVTACSTHGTESMTHLLKSMLRLNRYQNKKCTILHFADHDPTGVDMSRDIVERSKKYEGLGLGKKNFTLERCGLTRGQVKKHSLLPNPTKSKDPRTPAYVSKYGTECWELDALPPNVFKNIIRESIEKHINQKIWTKNAIRQEREHETILDMKKDISKALASVKRKHKTEK